MSYIISVYSAKAFKEILLPAINNADYSLSIPGTLFGLMSDIDISMEIMDGKWTIKPSDRYSFSYNTEQFKEKYNGEPLKKGDIFSGSFQMGGILSLIVHEVDSSFEVCDKFSLEGVSEVTIGKEDSNMIQYDAMSLISRSHARIVNKGGRHVVEDRSSNGTFVNAKRIVGSYQLEYGDCIDIFGLRIVYLNKIIAVSSSTEPVRVRPDALRKYVPVMATPAGTKKGETAPKSLFHRSPRNIPKLETDRIEIDSPPSKKELNQQPTFMAIGPALTMALPMVMGCALSIYSTKMNGGSSGAFMYTGLVTALGSSIIGTVWAIVNMKRAKEQNREDELKRFEAYGDYLIKRSNEIKQKYDNNTQGMRTLYPDASRCCSYNDKSVELWNRNARHADFLSYRLGTGAIPFQVAIDIPKEKFDLINDSLAEKPRLIKESFKMLRDVPVCLDLFEHKVVGVVGGKKKAGCYPVVHNLVAQIAASNCYTDVKMVFIYDADKDENGNQWGFAKWLPHVWSEDKKTRYVASNKEEASEVFYELTKVLRQRLENRNGYSDNVRVIPKPYYIIFIENISFLEGELISKYIQDDANNCGVSTVMLTDGYENLPNKCEFIVENGAGYCGMYGVADGADDRIGIRYDMISSVQLENFARRLASIEVSETETGGEIPNMLTFFDMYGVKHPYELNVIDRWKKNRTYDTLKALVGQKGGGVDCYLDVHEKYHGPHGLVAGTTGSGKSETLQTYMLSLAINFSPDDVGFFVIDYKGGGMANLFNGLPHMIGKISNLSGNQVHRAMVSIKSENMRRQRIFSEHGVNNINLYTRLYKNNEASIPVPHMFIIIDEFAELKREEPEFMRELISVAQVGRSLGVHLILATQKPAGTVDDNIWSNSKFRLCLRVQDRQDSTDMLHRPDAAYITQAGRCYMQVGNDELFELFQSAWSGAVYDENAGSVQTNIAKMLSENGKAALVGSYAQLKLKEKIKCDWVNQLVNILVTASNNSGISIRECAADSALCTSLINSFFNVASERGVDYAQTDYNRHRVLDFITILSGMDSYDVSDENLANRILAKASTLGKKLPEMKEKTQLDAVIEYLAKVAKDNGYVHNLQLWLPVLPEVLYLRQLSGYSTNSFDGNSWPQKSDKFTLDAYVGLYDDPVNQAQQPLSIDLALNGNHAVVGTVTSGKSTFLMTYIYSLVSRYSPDAVNLYILDYSSKSLGAFEGLPHVGGVIYESDDEKVSKFFTLIENILEERKKMFKGGSYSQYIQAHGLVVPAIVIAIDNMASFRTKTDNEYEDLMITLLKEGAGYGIFFIVTAAGFGLSEIPVRMGDNFRTIICLEMNDKFAYTDALRTFHLDVLPEENVKGRGLAKVGDSFLEFQTALTVPAEDDYKRGEAVKDYCASMSCVWTGKRARKIPEIPENPVWSDFAELEEVKSMLAEGVYLPIGYDKKYATAYGVNLKNTYSYMVSGRARCGKTNMLKNIVDAASKMNGQIAIIDFSDSMRSTAEEYGCGYYTTSQEVYDYFESIISTFKDRNAKKKELVAAGVSDDELYDGMQMFKKQFIIIDDLPTFANKVHNPDVGVKQMAPAVTNLLAKGAQHNVFWFAGVNPDELTAGIGLETYNLFTKNKTGIHFGGNVSGQRLLPFDHVPYMEQGKTQKLGMGMLPTHEYDDTTMIVVPLYKS